MLAQAPHHAAQAATRAALLADMLLSEHEYMNERQLRFFRHRLETLRASLAERAGRSDHAERETELVLPDPADQASAEQESVLEWRVRDLDRKLLKKIDEALLRIDAGDYGWCDETGDPIGIPRLLANPTATLTVEAQTRRERLERLYR